MTVANDALVIGLAGPFGSGCTTSSAILRDRLGYDRVQLSDLLRREWTVRHDAKTPSREDLQKLGNEIRAGKRDAGALAAMAIDDLEKDQAVHRLLVFDGIRNVGEVASLRAHFGFRFFLFAIDCSPSDRWQRLEPDYRSRGESEREFANNDRHDRDEQDMYGQQVVPCMDMADVLLNNDDSVTLLSLTRKVVGHAKLVSGELPRYANADEIFMNLAYTAAHSSKCLKRQVGAIIVEPIDGKPGAIVAAGYNENPIGTAPCVEEPKYGADLEKGRFGRCHRDIVREESYREHSREGRRCPKCTNPIDAPTSKSPPWRCSHCASNLDNFFWPDRAMSLCTAVHAEDAAIHAAGMRARGGILYTTTFPCFLCSEKVANAGIREVVFTEPYPDVRAAGRLDLAGIAYRRFEGVRSWRFDQIFGSARPYAESRQ